MIRPVHYNTLNVDPLTLGYTKRSIFSNSNVTNRINGQIIYAVNITLLCDHLLIAFASFIVCHIPAIHSACLSYLYQFCIFIRPRQWRQSTLVASALDFTCELYMIIIA